VLAVAVALLVGIVAPASAQFFNFGGPPRAAQPRSGGWFGGDLFAPFQQQAPKRVERTESYSRAPPPPNPPPPPPPRGTDAGGRCGGPPKLKNCADAGPTIATSSATATASAISGPLSVNTREKDFPKKDLGFCIRIDRNLKIRPSL